MLVRVLGAPAVVGSTDVVAVRGRPQAALLGLLAMEPGRAVRRSRLEAELWGEVDVSDAALRVVVRRLRQHITGAGAADLVRADASGYILDCLPRDVDATRFAALAGALGDAERRGDDPTVMTLGRAASQLWTGEPFDGVDDVPSLGAHTVQLRSLRNNVDQALGAALIRAGNLADAEGVLRCLTTEDPYRERGWALLVVCLYRAQHRGDALTTCRHLRELLADELGLAPAADLTLLEEAMLTGAPAEHFGEHLLRHNVDLSSSPLRPAAREPSLSDAVAALSSCRSDTGARRLRHVLDDQGPMAALDLLGTRSPDSPVALDAVRIEALAQAGRIVAAHALLADATDRALDVDERICVALAHAACDPPSVLAVRHEIELLLAAVPASDLTALLLRTALAEGYAFSSAPQAAVPHLDVLFDHLALLGYSRSARVHLARREYLAAVGAGADQRGIFYAGIVEMAAQARNDRDRMPLQRAILGDLYQAGDLNAFAAVLDDYRSIAEGTASTADIWCCKAMDAAMALVRDPLDVVIAKIDEAQQYGAARGHHSAAETADAQLVVALLAHGQLGDLADMVDERTKEQGAVAWRAMAAVALALAGRNDDAAAAIADVRGAGFATMQHDWLRRPALALAAHTAYLLHDRGAARELLPLLAASGVETIVIGNSIANLGPTSRYIGLLHATTGDLELAASGLAAASSLAKRMRSTTYEAHCSAELSTLEQPPRPGRASPPAVSVKH